MTAGLAVENLRSALAGPFDFAVTHGSCACITGASGSGKSLLLRMIADLDPNEGTVRFDGQDRESLSATAWRKRVTYVSAESGWWADSVAAHFADADIAAARPLIARLELKPELMDAPVARLSTGEKQRLALVRALLAMPPVLLLDEPTSALDESSTAQVESILRERMAAGACVVMVTHDERQAGRLASQSYEMAKGRMRLL